ncbi:hypothetical protein U9M48_025201 [Paspalum notatum var. saurae]|uniref:Uncharacterized protein n=1 Tax=Paspalum notatum var. saurae TaxID=547442 RepID=A0AAQ3WXA5_PASNO
MEGPDVADDDAFAEEPGRRDRFGQWVRGHLAALCWWPATVADWRWVVSPLRPPPPPRRHGCAAREGAARGAECVRDGEGADGGVGVRDGTTAAVEQGGSCSS